MSTTTDSYARLADDVYKSISVDHRPLGTDFKVIEVHEDEFGYFGAIYESLSTGELVVAHRGTEFENDEMRDLIEADGQMALLKINQQLPGAEYLVRRAQELAAQKGGVTVTVTGHSLGGALAQVTAFEYGLYGETFNAYGAAGQHDTPAGGNQVVNYIRVTDAVAAASTHFGEIRAYATSVDKELLFRHGVITLLNFLELLPDETHKIDQFFGPDSILTSENLENYISLSLLYESYRLQIFGAAHAIETLLPQLANFSPLTAIAYSEFISFLRANNDAAVSRYAFAGTNVVDVMAGKETADYMRGLAGDDRFSGAGGDDLIYGDSGDDVLRGQTGNDKLYGGDDNDYLDGGVGNDFLDGGAGFDQYDFSIADFEAKPGGNDVVADSDGSGVFTVSGVPIQVGERLDEHVWKSTDGQFRIIVVNKNDGVKTLILEHISTGSTILVNDWIYGTLGISPDGTVAPPVTDIVTTLGDSDDSGDVSTNPNNSYNIIGYGGNDGLSGGTGDDVLFGGSGSDYLSGGPGSDRINGGVGDDFISEGDAYFVWSDSMQIPNPDKSIDFSDFISIPIEQYVASLAADDPNIFTHGNAWYLRSESGATQNAPDYYGSLTVGTYVSDVGYNPSLYLDEGDVIDAGDGSDIVLAGRGDDVVTGGDGNDVLAGGQDNDSISGDAGDDIIYGDRIRGTLDFWDSAELMAGNDVLQGGDGDDQIYGQGGADIISGGAGNDRLLGDDEFKPVGEALDVGDDSIDGGDGDDLIWGGAGSDTLSGGAGADFIQGDYLVQDAAAQGNDVIHAGNGNDSAIGYGGSDIIYGDEGNDILEGDFGLLSSELHGNDILFGGVGNDTLFGDGGSDLLDGGEDNDLLFGDAGDDSLIGGAGTDELSGGLGNDSLAGGLGNDKLFGEDGNDTLDGGEGDDELQGGEGDDSLEGGAGVDLLFGNSGNDRLSGGAGNDQLLGGDGQDAIDGGEGDDLLQAGAGDDRLSGGANNDTLIGEDGNDSLSGGDGNDQAWGGIGNDIVHGNAGDDMLNGDDINVSEATHGDDAVYGDGGNDILFGNGGKDFLDGGIGDDELQGGTGDDTIVGGLGNDRLIGGAGNDVYLYSRGDGADVITETGDTPSAAMDTLRLSAGILPEHISLHRARMFSSTSDDLVIVVTGSNEPIIVANFFGDENNQIERIEFDNGTGIVWDEADILSNTEVGTPNVMTGTAGGDIFIVDHEDDVISDSVGGGVDWVESNRSYALSANIENLALTGVLNISAYGNSDDNILSGNSGNNFIDGKDGADSGFGGAGNDTYVNVENVYEEAGAGTDTVQFTGMTPSSYTLPDNVENMFFQTSYFSVHHTLFGNSLNNVITFDNGSNMLTDAATLNGGTGADQYVFILGSSTSNKYVNIVIDDPGDTWKGYIRPFGFGPLVEAGGNAFKIESYLETDFTFDFTVKEYTSLGATAISVHGDDRDNEIRTVHNSAVNVVSGGLGNDTYYIGTNDIIVEDEVGGVDTVFLEYGASGSYTMAANTEKAIINTDEITQLVGNDINNTITSAGYGQEIHGMGGDDVISSGTNGHLYGEEGDDRLIVTGGGVLDGGVGADYMEGSSAFDIFYVDNAGDQVIGSGYDKVFSSIDYTIDEGFQSLELLNGATSGTGNTQSNLITGNDAANTLRGLQGYDYLYGGGGADTYIYDLGDESDFIIETANTTGEIDVLQLGVGITTADVQIKKTVVDGIYVQIDGQKIYISDGLEYAHDHDLNEQSRIEEIHFADGTIWNVDDVVVSNAAPILGQTIPTQELVKGQLYSFTLPANAFVNDPGEPLAISVQYLPDWLSFDAMTNTFTGTPPANAALYNTVQITATDTWNQSVSLFLNVFIFNQINGTSGADSLIGTNDLDLIYGLAGNDTLNGGQGSDRMIGGQGDDSYVVDDELDAVVEAENEGIDTVSSSVTYTLSANVEKLILTGSGAIGGIGNALANTLTGNSKANILDAGSGDDVLDGKAGADTLIGGTGNDSYVIDNIGDVVVELAGQGLDTVSASVTYTLGENIENLTLTGSAAISGVGNSIDNTLNGNSGNNQLTGGAGNDTLDGKSGNDTMIGGLGDDLYVVGSASDSVQEFFGEGIDTVQASIAWTLGNNVENLLLLGTSGLAGTGNTLDNVLTGNSGNNALGGLGGNDILDGVGGTDSLSGGVGSDTYLMARAYGTDTVIENDTTVGVIDVARFLTGISYDQLWFRKPSGTNNLEISIIGTTDKLIIKDWYLGSQYRVEEIRTDDGNMVLSSADVQALVNAMAGLTIPAQGQLNLPTSYRTTLDPVFASTWQPQLGGGSAIMMTPIERAPEDQIYQTLMSILQPEAIVNNLAANDDLLQFGSTISPNSVGSALSDCQRLISAMAMGSDVLSAPANVHSDCYFQRHAQLF